jgi:hypothetical protein
MTEKDRVKAVIHGSPYDMPPSQIDFTPEESMKLEPIS